MQYIQKQASQILEQVSHGRALRDVLAEAQAQMLNWSASERGAWLDLCYGSVRYLGELRFYARQLVPKPMANSRVECLLLVALYQLNYTKATPYTIVNEAVKAAASLAKGRFKALINAALRNFLRHQATLQEQAKQNRVAYFNHPEHWICKVKQAYPDQWQAILAANQTHPPMTLRVNARYGSAEDYLKHLQTLEIPAVVLADYALMLETPVSVRALPGFEQGWVSVQDWGAQQAAWWLDLQPGQRVLDACAAPGGKTGHILECCDVELTAIDKQAERLEKVKESLERLQLKAQRIVQADVAEVSVWWDGLLFDRILADVPCSASGVVRRHPDIKWLRQPSDWATFAQQQVTILDQLWLILAKYGKMLYATCSIFPEENQQQLTAFLARHTDAICLQEKQLLPCDQHDGFYYALLQKS